MKQLISTLTLSFALMTPALAQPAASSSAPSEELNKKQLHTLIVNAKTSADHKRIADLYQAAATVLIAQSGEHAAMAAQFKANPITAHGKFTVGTVDHCEYLSQSLKQEALKDQALAKLHYEMAESSIR